MPQYVTFNIGAKVDKGPEIKSEAKFEAGSYGAVIEEAVCKCSPSEEIELPLSPLEKIDMLVISADKYSVDKETCMPPNGMSKMECKTIRYWFSPESSDPANGQCGATPPPPAMPTVASPCPSPIPPDSYELTRPLVLMAPFIECIVPNGKSGIRIQNNLTTDIKISAMVIRKKKEMK